MAKWLGLVKDGRMKKLNHRSNLIFSLCVNFSRHFHFYLQAHGINFHSDERPAICVQKVLDEKNSTTTTVKAKLNFVFFF